MQGGMRRGPAPPGWAPPPRRPLLQRDVLDRERDLYVDHLAAGEDEFGRLPPRAGLGHERVLAGEAAQVPAHDRARDARLDRLALVVDDAQAGSAAGAGRKR